MLIRRGSLAKYESRCNAASTNQNEGSPVGRRRVSDHRDCYVSMMAGRSWRYYIECCILLDGCSSGVIGQILLS